MFKVVLVFRVRLKPQLLSWLCIVRAAWWSSDLICVGSWSDHIWRSVVTVVDQLGTSQLSQIWGEYELNKVDKITVVKTWGSYLDLFTYKSKYIWREFTYLFMLPILAAMCIMKITTEARVPMQQLGLCLRKRSVCVYNLLKCSSNLDPRGDSILQFHAW